VFASRTNWTLAKNSYALAIEAARLAGATLLDLTVSNPTECGFDFDSQSILAALARAESLRYDPQPQGLLSAREAVARYYAELPRAETLDPRRILLTVSTSEAYSFLFRLLCNPGDEVLIAQPSYPLFEFLADVQDVQLRTCDLFYDHGWHFDMGLERAIGDRTRAVLIVNPNNPTGSFVHAQELEALAQLCRERELALISDEVFLDYSVEGGEGHSIVAVDECLSFTLSGLSKISCLPQIKLAWIVANGPPQLLKSASERLEVIADTYLSVNAQVQHALPALLEQRHRIKPQLLSRIRANLARLYAALSAAPHVERLRVEGGWYAVLRVPVLGSDEELAIRLVERENVLIHPGHFYNFPGEGYLVLSLITPEATFSEGVARLLTALS
jgi:alanine-synthesizing transaminase